MTQTQTQTRNRIIAGSFTLHFYFMIFTPCKERHTHCSAIVSLVLVSVRLIVKNTVAHLSCPSGSGHGLMDARVHRLLKLGHCLQHS